MTGYLDETVDTFLAFDRSRARSQQTDIGLSELGGCRQAIGYKLTGTWESDDTDTWRAIVGTIMHDANEAIRSKAYPHLEYGHHVTYRGTGGHPDEVDPQADRVAEWKFPRLSTSRLWQDDPEAFSSKRGQAHGYAAGLVDAGILTEACTVVVCVMPVDGTYDDWWTHEEPFDRSIADAMADRREEVERLTAEGRSLPRDKPFTWCEQFCEFFTICRGGSSAPENEPITEPELASAARQYRDVLDQLGPLEKRKKGLATELRGHRGVVPAAGPDDLPVRVAMTKPSGEKEVTDLDAVAADFAARGVPLPTKTVPTSSPSLRVTAIKPSAKKRPAPGGDGPQ